MKVETRKATAEAEARALLDKWHSAVVAADVDAIVANYAPDVVGFDAIKQLQFKGREAYGTHWKACMEMCGGVHTFEPHELTLAAGDDVGFVHAVVRCGGTGPDGKEQVGWMRMTQCLEKRDGKWMIVHEHFSAPIDMETGQAIWDSQP